MQQRIRLFQTLSTKALTRVLPHLRKAHAWVGSVLDEVTPPPAVEAPRDWDPGHRWTGLREPVAVPPAYWYRYVLSEDSLGAQVNLVTRLTFSSFQGRTNVADRHAYRQAMKIAGALDAGDPPPALAPVGMDIHECYFDFEMPTEFEDLLARTQGRTPPWGPGSVDVEFDDSVSSAHADIVG